MKTGAGQGGDMTPAETIAGNILDGQWIDGRWDESPIGAEVEGAAIDLLSRGMAEGDIKEMLRDLVNAAAVTVRDRIADHMEAGGSELEVALARFIRSIDYGPGWVEAEARREKLAARLRGIRQEAESRR